MYYKDVITRIYDQIWRERINSVKKEIGCLILKAQLQSCPTQALSGQGLWSEPKK